MKRASRRLSDRSNISRRGWLASILAGLALLAVTIAAAPGWAGESPAPQDAAAAPGKMTVLITGANRGLGLEFARQYHDAGWAVIGTARRPGEAEELNALGVRVEQLDVTNPASVAALAERIGNGSIDLLINNAGIGQRAQTLKSVDVAAVERVMQVNYFGPLRVTKALLPALYRSERRQIVNITSGLGSIENNTGGGYYGYRESKAALNMFTRTVAAELKRDGFTCIVMSPGWVRTDMGGSSAPLSPEESIRGMRTVIDGLKNDDTGRFYRHTGEIVPW